MKNKKNRYETEKLFINFIKKAGLETDAYEINRRIIFASVIVCIIATFVFIVEFFIKKTFFVDALSFIALSWLIGFAVSFLGLWLGFFIYVDYTIYKRQKEIEAVFPDFLQLTSANISAGMPIERALWFSIRPKFGILAKEMEQVAKATMVGEKLDKALMEFSNKYDSMVIKRALNLLLEGLESGGEIGDLLNRVATNMRDTEIMKKEMASNVTTYVIFILFATLGAAPFLFGLTTELIVIMNSIFSNINIAEGGSSGGIGSFLGSGDAVSIKDYQTFAITSVIIASTFAAIIVSVIQKGNAKESLKQIPIYILIGLANYFISFKLLNIALGGFFG